VLARLASGRHRHHRAAGRHHRAGRHRRGGPHHHAGHRERDGRDAATRAPFGGLAPLLLLVLAGAAAGQREPALSNDAAAVLRRHAEAIGGAATLAAAGDLEVLGRFETVQFAAAHRTLIRREPFAVREEYRDPDGQVVQVHVTDLHHSWRLHDPAPGEPGSGRPHGHALGFDEAVPLVLRAWAWRILLDPFAATASGQLAPPLAMPEAPFFHEGMGEGRRALTVVLGGPLGVTPNLWFDAEDGLWLGWQWGPAPAGGMQRLRAGRWERRGGLVLPTLLLDFDERSLIASRTVEDVITGLEHDAALFAGDPVPPPAVPGEAPLAISPGNLPGSAHLVVGGVRVNGQGPWWATFDTGSNRLVVHPELADRLDLPELGPAGIQLLAGKTIVGSRWMDEVSLGGARWLQRVAVGLAPMRHLAQPARHQPALIVGTDLLAGLAPVMDLAGGRLLLRGEAPPTLAELAADAARDAATPEPDGAPLGAPRVAPLFAPLVAEAALHAVDDTSTSRAVELRVGSASVRALLDTGSSFALRLSPAGLRALGLPTGREAWLARGGLPYETVGLNAVRLPDLVVRLDELVLPAVDARDGSPLDVVWSRPLVIVSTADDEAAEPSSFAAIFGTGALLPFARVGVDIGRDRLELQPGPRVTHVTQVRSATREPGEPGKAGDMGEMGKAGELGRPGERGVEGGRIVVPPPGEYLGFLLRPADEDSLLPRLVEVVPGLPADRAGLAVGDALEQVDGADCAGMPLAELWPRLWLQDRDSVRLRVLRDGEAIEVELP
jgi:hypothetical protein